MQAPDREHVDRPRLRDALTAEVNRLGVTRDNVRVRYDVAPEVRLQDVVIAIDATFMAGIADRWFSGIR